MGMIKGFITKVLEHPATDFKAHTTLELCHY